jgi:hypothetical protein
VFSASNRHLQESRGSVAGRPIATSYGLDDRGVGVRAPVWSRIFSSPRRPDRLWSPPNLLSNGYRGVKRPKRETDHSPTANVEVKKMWIYTSLPHTPSWRSVSLFKHRDFTFLPLTDIYNSNISMWPTTDASFCSSSKGTGKVVSVLN